MCKINKIPYKKFILNISLFFLFFITNAVIIILLLHNSKNLSAETFKWLQFLILIFLSSIFLGKSNKYWFFFVIFIFFFFYYSLIIYYVLTHSFLDFAFFIRNIKDIGNVMPQAFYPLLIIAICSFFNSLFIFFLKDGIKNNTTNKKLYFLPLIIFLLLPTLLNANSYNNELIKFTRSIYLKDNVINDYQKKYLTLIGQSSNLRKFITAETKEKKEQPEYLDNIIILHLESLNGFLVNENNTPNLINISKKGVFFPKFYGNSIQTILAYENIFCSLPSSFDKNLVNSDYYQEVMCLPEILNNFGYKSYFFKGGVNLKSTNTDTFINGIKFNELHNSDIMQNNDEKYQWGYREDIFYSRTFAYLKEKVEKNNNFIYIDVGSTNHWPFKTPPGMENDVPYEFPKNHQERLINTIFLQDKYLKIALEKINNIFPEKNYTLLILGDHSWPAEMHENNTYNEKNSFEENFTTAMVLIIGDEEKYKNVIINTKYSQMDILPSILDLTGINLPHSDFRRSFVKELEGEKPANAKIILIQPYADRYINIIENDYKYQYNSEYKNITFYNLNDDPSELNGKIISEEKNENLSQMKRLLE